MFENQSGLISGYIEYDSPSTAVEIGLLLVDSFYYFVLMWYFDHVVSSNRGRDESYFFFLKAKY